MNKIKLVLLWKKTMLLVHHHHHHHHHIRLFVHKCLISLSNYTRTVLSLGQGLMILFLSLHCVHKCTLCGSNYYQRRLYTYSGGAAAWVEKAGTGARSERCWVARILSEGATVDRRGAVQRRRVSGRETERWGEVGQAAQNDAEASLTTAEQTCQNLRHQLQQVDYSAYYCPRRSDGVCCIVFVSFFSPLAR